MMKKKKITVAAIGLSAILCAGCFAACGSCNSDSPTTFNAYWYAGVAETVVPGTSETLIYDVRTEAESGTNSSYSLEYKDGTYTATLSAVMHEGKLVYSYETSLRIVSQYFFQSEQSEEFNDFFNSKVLFDENMHPVSSEKTVHCHSPAALTPQSLEGCFTEYYYTVVTEYAKDGNSGSAVKAYKNSDGTDRDPKAEKTLKFSIGSKYSYVDNEELLFALRGVALSASTNLYVYNASQEQVQTVSITPQKEVRDEFEFAIGEETKKRNISYYPTNIAISSDFPGGTQTAWYAKTATGTENYRNVMLRLSTPVSYSLGNLVYTLKSATFTER